MSERLAAAVTGPRGRWLTIAIWVALAVGGYFGHDRIGGVTAAGQASFLPADSESTRAIEALDTGGEKGNGRAAEEVDDDDGAGARRDAGAHGGGIEAVGGRIDVREDGRGAGLGDAGGGGRHQQLCPPLSDECPAGAVRQPPFRAAVVLTPERPYRNRADQHRQPLLLHELADDRPARGVGESVKHEIQPRRSVNNHMVYYTIWFCVVNPDFRS